MPVDSWDNGTISEKIHLPYTLFHNQKMRTFKNPYCTIVFSTIAILYVLPPKRHQAKPRDKVRNELLSK